MTKGLIRSTKPKQKRKVSLVRSRPTNLLVPSSTSSTITTTTTTTDTTTSGSSQGEEEGIPINILEALYDTSDESAEEEEQEQEEDFRFKTLAENMGFFDGFLDVPDMDVISEDISVANIMPIEEPKSAVSKMDTGRFVDPLTGLAYGGGSTSSFASASKKSLSSGDTLSGDSLQSDLLLYDTTLDEEPYRTSGAIDNKDLLDELFALNESKADENVEEIDFDAIVKQEEAKKRHQQTVSFINDLIHSVVRKIELLGPDLILAKNLDKRKLLLEFYHLNQKCEEELKISEFLNRKVMEFYKRRKLYRAITEENPKHIEHEKNNYLRAMKRLDEQLTKQKKGEVLLSNTTTRIRNELIIAEMQHKNNVLRFEGIVKRTLWKEDRPQLNALITYLLNKMGKYRKEISDLRFEVIVNQHSQAQLQKEFARLEDLGDGLTIKDYNNIQTENLALDKKIEERSGDLNKLHQRSRNHQNMLAHFHEKREILTDLTEKQYSIFNRLYNEYTSMRKYIYQLKLKRSQLRKEIDKLSFQEGLLVKPALLYDYDQTMDCLREEQEIVNTLRITLETIQRRISKLEKRLTQNDLSIVI